MRRHNRAHDAFPQDYVLPASLSRDAIDPMLTSLTQAFFAVRGSSRQRARPEGKLRLGMEAMCLSMLTSRETPAEEYSIPN
jgi:hypothetical protein